MKIFRLLMIITLILLCAFITSCLEVKQAININRDGSGDARLEITVMVAELIPKLKSEMPKGWSIIEEKEKEGKHVIVFRRKFKDISELNDDESRYTFSSERKGFLKKSYALKVKQIKSSDMPFPYEITIKVPGGIDETDGTKLSSSEVKWNLKGFRRGKELSIKSSAFAMADFVSLKESFNRIFNSVFYREAIVFERDKNLWVMDSNGKNQKQLTKDKVESWSVSKDGRKIAYEGKNNCYVISLGNAAKKLTDINDCFLPEISPDGNKVAFRKVDEKFSATEAQQKVSERGDNPEYLKEGATKKTGIHLFNFKTGQQKRIVGELPPQLSSSDMRNASEWSDYSLFWSEDGEKLHFTRDFIPYAEKGGYRDAYLINVNNNEIEYIGPQGHLLNWSSGKIIYTEEGYSYIYDIAGKAQTQSLKEFYRYPTFECLDWYGSKVLFSASDYSKGVILIFDTKTDSYKIFDRDMPYGITGNFSSDGKKIVYGYRGNLWTIEPDRNSKNKIASNLPLSGEKTWFLNTLLWTLDGKKILIGLLEVKSPTNETNSIWIIDSDGSNLNKIASNSLSPKWTLIPKITFISPSLTKTIILVIMALTSILLLFGIALITRKALKAVTPSLKRRGETVSKGTKDFFCSQCGKENSPEASFCTNCGQRLR